MTDPPPFLIEAAQTGAGLLREHPTAVEFGGSVAMPSRRYGSLARLPVTEGRNHP